MDDFEQRYPDVSRFWKDPDSLESLVVPTGPIFESAPIYDHWDKAAKRLMTSLWKCSQSWIFHEPVDPIKLGIPDYLVIVKHPMDFGTIK